MAFLSAFRNLNMLQNYENAFLVKDTTSPEMLKAIRLWFALYYDTAGHDEHFDTAQRVPYAVIDGLYKS